MRTFCDDYGNSTFNLLGDVEFEKAIVEDRVKKKRLDLAAKGAAGVMDLLYIVEVGEATTDLMDPRGYGYVGAILILTICLGTDSKATEGKENFEMDANSNDTTIARHIVACIMKFSR